MHASAFRCVAAVLLPACLSAAAPPPQALPTNQQHAIEAVARKDLSFYGAPGRPVPGAYIALYIPGKAPYIKSVGVANLQTKAPFRMPDRFRIGSNTKTFVVTVLLQLADEHKLNLDDPIGKFNIGVKVPDGNHITIRELCEMRSGLYEAYNTPQFDALKITPNTYVAPQQIVRWAVAQKPMFAPGAKWYYSNTNYIILGLIIQAVTHDTVAHQIETRLIRPIGLTSTVFPGNAQMPAPYAHGYALEKGKWNDVSVDLPPSIPWAAGAMISTVPDMARWVKSYVLGTMNSKASQRARLTCLPTGIGKGLDFGLGIGCSGGWYGYTGGIPGYHTAAYYLPSKDITMIVFVNAQREQPFPGAANVIARDVSRIITPGNVNFGGAGPKT